MHTLQKQIVEVDRKVNQLYQIVDGLSSQIRTLTVGKKQAVESLSRESQMLIPTEASLGMSSVPERKHKDILEDASTWEEEERKMLPLSSEIQIRRLTAQLTAAYNRIAALEEQLLAYRINS
ncbi:MAG: hypothetical protein DSM107014_02965 [Gomphosphaeria aponina SAG 52.96 = DSM 107014]|uniref:Uncharacterized protein n=1 Tax=Gomphosphaeria aponina SAG 52.96 = DSM 107014 TaxID=1521640 RepID=A0A941JNY7_9CHRO|nr:hypothetical protein [Gomphosphaeria aponina SAG 52.96 = DSM 107014]